MSTTDHPAVEAVRAVPAAEDYRIDQETFLATLIERFGDDWRAWAFVCPNCKDVATGADFRAALDAAPATRKDGEPVLVSDRLGQECIGRTLGALRGRAEEWRGRGCDWAAYGLFRGPLIVSTPDGREVASFRIATAAQVASRTAGAR